MECTWNLENFTLGLIAAQSDFPIFALGLITVQNDFQIFEFGVIEVHLGLAFLRCTSVFLFLLY